MDSGARGESSGSGKESNGQWGRAIAMADRRGNQKRGGRVLGSGPVLSRKEIAGAAG